MCVILPNFVPIDNTIANIWTSFDFYPRGASSARVIAMIACLSVCHTPVLYQND